MRILALETTEKIGSVAALADNNLLADLSLEPTQQSGQSLLPAIDRLLGQLGWQPTDVQLVAVSIGPGSFTGLRVGVTAAKVFAYAVGSEVLGVNTLETVAANCADMPSSAVSVVVDAQRDQLVVQSFLRQTDGWFAPAGAEELLDAEVWLARLLSAGESGEWRGESGQWPVASGQCTTASGQSTVESEEELPRPPSALRLPPSAVDSTLPFGARLNAEHPPSALRLPPSASPQPPAPSPFLLTGPGLAHLLDRLPPGVATAPRELWRPQAAMVGQLAARYYARGGRDDLWKLVPHYYRRSAAEEKWDARGLPPAEPPAAHQ